GRELTDGEQVAPGRIDVEATRLLFGRYAADRRQRARRRIDAEAGERARRALRAVEEAAVGRGVQVGGRRLAGEAGRQRADRLLLLQIAGGGVVVEDVDRPVELADDVDELAVRMMDEVARAGLRLQLDRGRAGRRQLPGGGVEHELVDPVVAERRPQPETVRVARQHPWA